MDFTLNELSLEKLDSNEKVVSVFMELADVASALHSFGFRTMKIWDKSQFLNFDFYNGFTLIHWLKYHLYSNNAERNKSQILKSIITKKDSLWNEDERTAIDNCPIIGIQLQDSQQISQGLKIAYLFKTIAVSINTSEFWNTQTLDLIYIYEDEIKGTFEQIVSVNHASKTIHIDAQKEWFNYLYSKKLINKDWIPSDNYFPHLEFSNQLMVNEDWTFFRKKLITAETQEEKRAIIIETGNKVAERNSYIYDKKVSLLNSKTKKRIIHGAGNGKTRIYLSIDLEKGGFEVCNYLGEHLGEYFFDGTKTGDQKPSHNIIVKS